MCSFTEPKAVKAVKMLEEEDEGVKKEQINLTQMTKINPVKLK